MASDPAVLQRMATAFSDIMLESGRYKEAAAALQAASAKRKQRLANPTPARTGWPGGWPAGWPATWPSGWPWRAQGRWLKRKCACPPNKCACPPRNCPCPPNKNCVCPPRNCPCPPNKKCVCPPKNCPCPPNKCVCPPAKPPSGWPPSGWPPTGWPAGAGWPKKSAAAKASSWPTGPPSARKGKPFWRNGKMYYYLW